MSRTGSSRSRLDARAKLGRSRQTCLVLGLSVAALAFEGRADAADAEVFASSVSFDAGRQEVVLEGDVRVDSPPFHLRSQHVRLRRSGAGPLELEGEGTLGFCPCLGTPLAVTFQGAKVAPPGDLFLERPVLSFFGVPVLWLPAFWLRAPTRPGLLPPDVAYRAADGVYVGLGAHLPWNAYAGASSLDLRGGVYTRGGGVVDARFFAPTSRTHVRLDHLQDTGVLVDARGHGGRASADLAWDVDVVRGRRALAATTRLDEAARPWDRAAAEGTLSAEGGLARVTFGALGTIPRGTAFGNVGASGPTVSAAAAHTSRDGKLQLFADTFGAALSDPLGTAVSFAQTRTRVDVVGGVGPVVARTTARGEATGEATQATRSGLGAVHLRTRLGLPLGRMFGDGLAHVVEPFVTGGIGGRTSGPLVGAATALAPISGDVPDVGSLTASLGARSSLGGPGVTSSMFEVDAAFGAVSLESRRAAPGAFARVTAKARLVGVSLDGAWLRDPHSTESLAYGSGRVRVGPEDGPRLLLHASFGTAPDASAARRLADGGAAVAGPFLASTTSSVGGRGVLPLARRVSLMAGGDGDLSARSLLGAFGGVELRDACQCLVLRTFGSHRIGREGVDVWLTLDVLGDAPPPR